MKTTIKNLILAFVLIAGFTTYAADFNVAVKEGYTLTVSLEQAGSNSNILLKDDQGVLLYSKQLNSKVEMLDLKNLPNGTYSLFMESDMVFEKTIIAKNDEGLSIFGDAQGTVFKPSFKKVDQVLRMSLTNPSNAKVNFKVYDANGLQVASTEGEGYIIKKSFDFNKGKSGDYVVKTTVGKQSFSKTISMN